jgi:hypothetical protein
VLCKGARIGHDRRSDVPTVGINTIKNMHAIGGGCLALAAGDVIMLDKDEMIQVADRLGIAIVGMPPAHAPDAQIVAPLSMNSSGVVDATDAAKAAGASEPASIRLEDAIADFSRGTDVPPPPRPSA